MSYLRKTLAASASYINRHRYLSALGALVMVGVIWWGMSPHGAAAQTRYVLGSVSTSTIISTVSASGQVSASDSIDVKAKASGTLTWVGVAVGDTVRAGEAIASIDDTDARQSLADANKQLAADELTYQKSAAQAPIDYQNDVNALATDKENLADDYNDAYNDLTGTYLDFPAVMQGAQETLYGYDFDSKKSQWNMDVLANLFSNQTASETANITAFELASKSDYSTAQASYDAAVDVYKVTPRTATTSAIDSLLGSSIAMATDAAQALQSELNFLGAVSDLAQTYNTALPSAFATLQSSTRSELSTANSDLSQLLTDKKTLDNAKQAITAAQQTIELDQVGNPDGSNPISLQVSQNSIEKEKEDIQTQQDDLADYTVVAPFAGTVSAVDVKVGDAAGSGAVATVISSTQVAQLSLNEVDAAKVKVGQKATLTFDAVEGLTLTGTVVEIDPVGTVSQGVVSYDIKIAFDAQNAQVKPGMTVNADIQTGVAQDVPAVPSAAVKTQNGQSYVLVFNPPVDQATIDAAGAAGVLAATPPTMVPVTTGLSDDTNIEITAGLAPGQQIVVGTRTGTAAASATSATRAATTGAGTPGARGNATFGGGGGAALRAGL